ncbi:putative methyltransferase-domain-containing protein [Mucidula mucida]|nr:putative methyltransferase-domain-containing protein [Mucidula mucida]
MSDTDDDLSLGSMFSEPPRPPSPEPTFSVYKRENPRNNDWDKLKIRLVGSHPLWAHHLWNAALALATYLDQHTELYVGGNVLELGAGGALPSIVTANNGASKVVVTDYPDDSLVQNLTYNVKTNTLAQCTDNVSIQGYLWGQSVQPLLDVLPGSSRFNLIILSDLIFNHSQHDALLNTCERSIDTSQNARVLVFYSHHRPHLAHKDMEFFSKARDRGWTCEEIVTKTFPPMFPDDPGSEEVRATVHGWCLRR